MRCIIFEGRGTAVTFTVLLILAVGAFGCSSDDVDVVVDSGTVDSGTNPGSWDVTGTVRGIDLQDDIRSAVSQRVDDGTSIRTFVTLANLDDYCARSREGSSCPTTDTSFRMVKIAIRGTATGTYPITNGDPLRPPAGEAGVSFIALDESCSLLGNLRADSGSVTLTEIDLAPGGAVALSFDVTTAEGAASGTVSAPYCD